MTKYCSLCKRNVAPVKHVSPIGWIAIIILGGATLGIFLVCFLIYYFLFKKPCCPICGATALAEANPNA